MGIQNFGASMLGDAARSADRFAGAVQSIGQSVSQVYDDKKRLENAQKDAVSTMYQDRASKTLPEILKSTDFDNYPDKLTQFNNDFIVELRSSGVYSDSILTWAEQDLLSSSSAISPDDMGPLATIGRDNMTASMAFGKANMLVADRSLSLDDSVDRYQEYYTNTGLAGLPMSYGVPDPEMFRNMIRQTKAEQAFKNALDQGYDSGWNTSEQLDKVLADSGVALTSEEMVAYKKAGYDAVKAKRTQLDVDSSETVAKFASEYYQFSNDSPDEAYDTTALEQALEGYPLEFQVSGLELLSNISKGNDVRLYNNLSTDVSSPGMRVDDAILDSFNDGKYADSYMAACLFADAQTVYRQTGSVQEAVKSILDADIWNRDMSAAKETAKDSLIQYFTDRKTTEEDAAELDAYFAMGTGITDTESVDVSPFNFSWYKGNIDLSSLPVVKNEDGTVSTVRSITIEEDGRHVVIPTVVNGKVVSDDEAIEHYHKTDKYLGIFDDADTAVKYAENLHKAEEFRTAGGNITWQTSQPEQIMPTYARQSTSYGLTTIKAAQVSEKFINNPAALSELAERLMQSGHLSPEDKVKESKPLFDSPIDLSLVYKAISGITSKYFDGQSVAGDQFEQNIKAWLCDEIREDPTLITDMAKRNAFVNRLDSFANEKQVVGLLSSFSKYSDVEQDPENFIRSMANKGYKEIIQELQAGNYDYFINNTAQNNLRYDTDGKIKSDWIGMDVANLRDWFAGQLGWSTSYEDLAEHDPSGLLRTIVEANVLYAKTEAAAVKTFTSAFSDMSRTPVAEGEVVSVWVGDGWAMQDPDVDGLFWIADWKSIDKKSDLPEWRYCRMDRKSNGTYDTLMAKNSYTLDALVRLNYKALTSDASSKVAQLHQNIANAGDSDLPSIEKSRLRGLATSQLPTAYKNEKTLSDEYHEALRQVFAVRANF